MKQYFAIDIRVLLKLLKLSNMNTFFFQNNSFLDEKQ